VVISETTKSALIKSFSIDETIVHVIPNTAPNLQTENNPRSDSSNTVLILGTRKAKNLPRQLQALAQLNDLAPKIIVIGELTKDQKTLIEQLNLTIDNRTNISDQELQKCYLRSDLLLFASLKEGFGMPIIEAQSAGLPVITSNVSSMPEVAGDSALLVNPYSVDEIAAATRILLTQASVRQELAKKGLENCKRFSAKTVGSLYADLYQLVAERAN